jgi:tripartite-type tricarboxylate transporter receptor subunit TctC
MTGSPRLAAITGTVALALGAPCVIAGTAQAQAYPSKPIRFVVPFTPGALNDLLARLVGEQLGTRLGQRVVVDNRPGAGTMLGSDLVAKSTADGYTLLLSSAPLAINPHLVAKLPFDAIRDLAGITQIGAVPFVIVCHPDFSAKSITELVALAKAKPGQLVYGATVAGQLMVEMFKSAAKVDIVHVPYKGLAPAMVDVMGGRVHLTLGTYSSLGPHVKSGRLRALAVTSRSRTRIAPDVPAIAEAGYKDFDGTSWYGISVASRTPTVIVSRLHSETVAILKQPEIERRLNAEGVDIVASDPAAFDQFIKLETSRWGKVIKDAGIKAGQET